MNSKLLFSRRMSAVFAVSVAGLGLFASWRAEAHKPAAAGVESGHDAAVVQDNESGVSLQTKLFLHRQGFVAQPSARSSK